jgi:ABC-type glycerol-3-phosphate transport system substrate-binding protein
VAKQGEGFNATLGYDAGKDVPPAESALQFFTQFSNPLSQAYTWNRAQIPARDAFIRESLVMYFGYASELPLIAEKNPNLNFDMTKVPQIPQARANTTFGKVYALGIIKAGKKVQQSVSLASVLTGKDNAGKLAEVLSQTAPIAPARRDLISTAPETTYGPVVYSSGLMARGWYDPGDYYTDPIMSTLIDDVIRGAASLSEAISKARTQLQLVL